MLCYVMLRYVTLRYVNIQLYNGLNIKSKKNLLLWMRGLVSNLGAGSVGSGNKCLVSSAELILNKGNLATIKRFKC